MLLFQRILLCTVATAIVATHAAIALESEGDAAGVRYGVYAPDWTWQGRDANIMAVFENRTAAAVTCSITLIIPADQASHFGRNGGPATDESAPLVNEVFVPPGETRRVALTGVTALLGFPRQTYPLLLTLRVNDTETPIDYPLRTIRGQAVSEGLAVSLGLPISVALLFSAAFAAVLKRTGAPGAWKTVPHSATDPESPEPWINQTPK